MIMTGRVQGMRETIESAQLSKVRQHAVCQTSSSSRLSLCSMALVRSNPLTSLKDANPCWVEYYVSD
jgi:hypothetical protein